MKDITMVCFETQIKTITSHITLHYTDAPQTLVVNCFNLSPDSPHFFLNTAGSTLIIQSQNKCTVRTFVSSRTGALNAPRVPHCILEGEN